MMNLIHHHRLHVPNTLAVFAAVLLLISVAVGYDNTRDGYSSSQETTSSTKIEVSGDENISDAIENKGRGLKLGLLLFRR